MKQQAFPSIVLEVQVEADLCSSLAAMQTEGRDKESPDEDLNRKLWLIACGIGGIKS